MIKGLNMNQRVEYIPLYDNDEPKTVFVLRPINGEERSNFQDDGKLRLTGTKIYDFLSCGVVEIRNFAIEGTIREKLVSIKDDRIIAELIEKVGELSEMTRQDQKN